MNKCYHARNKILEHVIVFNKIIQDLQNINRLEDTIIYVDNARRYFPDEN